MLKLNHKNLEVWNESLILVKPIYLLTEQLPKEEKYGLVSQINRASVSIISNLSEGSARSSKLERKRFYEIAWSSLVEIDSQIEILIALNFLSKENILDIEPQFNKVFAMLSNLIKSLR